MLMYVLYASAGDARTKSVAFLTAVRNLVIFSGLAAMKLSFAVASQSNNRAAAFEEIHTNVKNRAEAATSQFS